MGFEIPTESGGEVLGFLGIVLTSLVTYLVTRMTNRAQKEREKPEASSTLVETMQSIMREDRELSDRQIAEERAARKRLEARVDGLEESEKHRDDYDAYLADAIQGLRKWADREGKVLPPPPLVGYAEWRANNSEDIE